MLINCVKYNTNSVIHRPPYSSTPRVQQVEMHKIRLYMDHGTNETYCRKKTKNLTAALSIISSTQSPPLVHFVILFGNTSRFPFVLPPHSNEIGSW